MYHGKIAKFSSVRRVTKIKFSRSEQISGPQLIHVLRLSKNSIFINELKDRPMTEKRRDVGAYDRNRKSIFLTRGLTLGRGELTAAMKAALLDAKVY